MLKASLLCWHLVPVAIFTLGWATVNPTSSAVLIEENFSTDVIASGDWIATDTSVVVDTVNGWLRIGANGIHDGGATKVGSCQLPLVIEWRMRTLDGQGEYFSLPKLEFSWGPNIDDRYHVTYVQDDQSGNPSDDGWLFGSWSDSHTLGSTGWNEWRTVRAIIRSDGGELSVKQDCDPDFTLIVEQTWTIPIMIQEFRLSQISDDVSDFDYLRVFGAVCPGVSACAVGSEEDVNNDGSVSVLDVVRVIGAAFRSAPETPDTCNAFVAP